jgi:hypothetical protein
VYVYGWRMAEGGIRKKRGKEWNDEEGEGRHSAYEGSTVSEGKEQGREEGKSE